MSWHTYNTHIALSAALHSHELAHFKGVHGRAYYDMHRVLLQVGATVHTLMYSQCVDSMSECARHLVTSSVSSSGLVPASL